MLAVAVGVIAGFSMLVTLVLTDVVISALAPSDAQDAIKSVAGEFTSGLVSRLAVLTALAAIAGLTAWVLERRKQNLQPPPVIFPGV